MSLSKFNDYNNNNNNNSGKHNLYGQFHVRLRRNQPSKFFLKKWNFLGIQTCRA